MPRCCEQAIETSERILTNTRGKKVCVASVSGNLNNEIAIKQFHIWLALVMNPIADEVYNFVIDLTKVGEISMESVQSLTRFRKKMERLKATVKLAGLLHTTSTSPMERFWLCGEFRSNHLSFQTLQEAVESFA